MICAEGETRQGTWGCHTPLPIGEIFLEEAPLPREMLLSWCYSPAIVRRALPGATFYNHTDLWAFAGFRSSGMLWLQLQETLDRNGNSASTRACCEAVPAPASRLAALRRLATSGSRSHPRRSCQGAPGWEGFQALT